VLWHEPVGRLERMIDFGVDTYKPGTAGAAGGSEPPQARIASAVNLVDTLIARLTVKRSNILAHTIESYAELGTLGRLAYQAGTFFTPVAALPFVRDLTHAQVAILPPGPSESERDAERHTVVLEIEDPVHDPLVVWRWHTTNPYDFTARVVVNVAQAVAADSTKKAFTGWLTPSQLLRPKVADLTSSTGYLRGCELERAR